MFKKIFFGILLICVLGFGGLTYYVSNLDWNTYKDKIAEKFFELTGKEIEFGGQLNVSLLPQPIITAENISVYNQGENKKALATVEKLETSVSLFSLLDGAPDVTSLSLSGAKVWIEQYENGRYNWSYNEGDSPSGAAKKTSLHNLSLQNAGFYYENKAADVKFDLEKVNAEVQAAAFDGPYRLDGNFTKDNEHFAIAVGIGSLASIDGIEINFSISHPASESFLRFDGTYNPQEQNVKGDFSGGSQKTAQFANILAQREIMDEKTQQELQFSSGVELDKTAVELSSFVTKYADDIEGSGSLNYPLIVEDGAKRQIDVKYEFLNVNLRHFYPAVAAQYEKFKADGEEYVPDTNFNIKADLAAKHIDFSDNEAGYLENVTLKADWTDNVLTIEELYASATGDTSISISGDLREEDEKPHYFLKNSVISTDFLSFANALDANIKSYVQSSYRNAGFDFSIVGDNGGFKIENAEFSMDKMKINADVDVIFSADEPEIALRAKADNFNFDNYLPDDNEQRGFWAQLTEDAENSSFLNNMIFDIDFAAENAVFRSTPMSEFNLKIADNKGKLNLKKLSIQNIAGASLSINGEIELKDEGLEFKEITTEINTANIADLISQINFNVPDWKIFKTKSFTMSAILSGNLSDFDTKITANADGIDMSYEGKIKSVAIEPDFSGNLGLKTTNTGLLLDGLNIEAKSIPNRNGALNCEGQISLSNDKFEYTEAKCMLGTSEYTGDVKLSKTDDKYQLKANVNADEFNLAYLFDFNKSKVANFGTENSFDNTFIAKSDWSRDTLDLSKYKNLVMDMDITAKKGVLRRLIFDNPHFKLINKDNALKLEEIDTTYKNARYTGEISMSYANPDMPEIKGNLKFENLDVGLLGGSIYMFNNGVMNGKTAFESTGASAYDVFTNISGYISMTVENLNFKGFNLYAIQNDIASRKYSKGLFQVVRDNLQQGETSFEPFDVTIAMKNGTLTVANLNLINAAAKSDLNFEVSLKDWKITSKMTVSLNEVGEVPSFDVSLNGNLQKPSLEINIENMVKNYDEHWKQIEENEKAQQEEIRRELNAQMQTAQNAVEKLSENLNAYTPKVEEYKQKSKKPENLDWYTNKLAEIGLINNELDAMKTKAHTPDFTAEDIAGIEEKIANYNAMISLWNDEITKRYAEDIDDRLSKLINSKSNIDINLQKLKNEFEQSVNEKTAELTKLKLQNKLAENVDFQRRKTDFYSLCDNVSQSLTALNESTLPLNTMTDIEQKEASVANAENMLLRLSEQFSGTENQQKDLLKITNDIFLNILKENEEAEQEAGEATVIKPEVVPSEQQEKTEKQLNKNLLREVSATDEMIENLAVPEQKTQGIVVHGYETKAPENHSTPEKPKLLKEVDGAVRKASGTIIVK